VIEACDCPGDDPRRLINDPRRLINDPRRLINDPRRLINDPRKLINDPRKLIVRSRRLIVRSRRLIVVFARPRIDQKHAAMPDLAGLESIRPVRESRRVRHGAEMPSIPEGAAQDRMGEAPPCRVRRSCDERASLGTVASA
jgi:hypothetical protein